MSKGVEITPFLTEKKMKTYKCTVCGWIYDEIKGAEKEGIAPGTKWEDVPEDWVCPDCGVTKDQFDMVEI